MAVLTKSEILKRVKAGEIIIEPFEEKAIGPASIDLHLGNEFRIFKAIKDVYHVDKKADYREITKLVTIDKFFLLMPGQTAHGITVEKISLPDDICAWIEGRSSLGRLGLMVHITAGFVHPGTCGKQVLEFNNAGPVPLAIYPGISICQLIFLKTLGKAKYRGRFTNQETP
ncbi:dCTP deaminase [Patescibacteria group bacterium]|nr:dCTP deaminase [Patescibacteria group bacterium]MBU1931570.1 dCTP deaminase [Patescibacteria group bacterium]